jgi:hypothetical protein
MFPGARIGRPLSNVVLRQLMPGIGHGIRGENTRVWADCAADLLPLGRQARWVASVFEPPAYKPSPPERFYNSLTRIITDECRETSPKTVTFRGCRSC